MLRQLILAILLLVAAPAAAQFDQLDGSQAAVRDNAITPELVIDARATPGSSADLAILMRVKPGWHGYWLNPGDAGLPMSVEWTLPKGWSVGPLRYPVPHRLSVQGIVNYVYERDYAVLTRVTAPAGATGSAEIRAKMRWLACTDKVCVPEQGEATVTVPTGGMATPDPRFNDWRQALPRPLSSKARFERRGEALRIAIPLPASVGVTDPYFYPATDGAIAYDAPQTFRRDGDWLIAALKTGTDQPGTIAGVLSYGASAGLEIAAVPGAVPSGGAPIGDTVAPGLLAALLGALLGGVILNLMPCVFPILAIKALHLARAGGSERAARRDALAYAAGAVIGTAALGGILLLIRAGGSAAGWAFQLQDPRTTMLLLLLAVAITLNLLKAFELPVLAGERAPAGSFGTGALAAFVATPCAGPFMGVALGAALLMPLWGSVLVFAALGLGLALPFVLIAFVPAVRRMLPKPGPWMARLQRFLAVPMAATAVACLWLLYRQGGQPALLVGAIAAVLLALLLTMFGRRQMAGTIGWPMALAGLVAIAGIGIAVLPKAGTGSAHVPVGVAKWSDEAVRAAQATGKPVFVYFTADWCLSCKANEAAAIERSETLRAFRDNGVTVLAGDWTNGDPAIGRLLESRGRAGVPLYLWYAAGAAEPEELPQILTPSMLIDRARAPARASVEAPLRG
ncbi:MAG: protein-disulfide reductase DsbD domain-containing protein [Sphingomicrobium sp.]